MPFSQCSRTGSAQSGLFMLKLMGCEYAGNRVTIGFTDLSVVPSA